MKKHLNPHDDVFISAQQGWEQMQLLLDEKLPVKNRKPAWKFYFPTLVAVSLATLFSLSTLVLNNTAFINLSNSKLTMAGANKPESANNIVPLVEAIIHSKNDTEKRTVSHTSVKAERISKAVESTGFNNLTIIKNASSEVGQKIICTPMKTMPTDHLMAKSAVIAIPKDLANSVSSRLPENVIDSNQKRNWNLSAGLAMNAVIGQQQNFRPYPTAAVRYNISNRFFLSAGLSIGSPVSGESRGVKKTVYINDLVNNIQYYNNVDHYYNFSYADMPVLAGVNISKKFSLQAGLQASVLLKAKTKSIIEQYDFQMRFAGGGSNGLMTGTAATVSETEYRVAARKIDSRFTTGIQYNLNKVAINLMYQHSLQPVLTGDFTSRNKHQLVTLNMQVRIK